VVVGAAVAGGFGDGAGGEGCRDCGGGLRGVGGRGFASFEL